MESQHYLQSTKRLKMLASFRWNFAFFAVRVTRPASHHSAVLVLGFILLCLLEILLISMKDQLELNLRTSFISHWYVSTHQMDRPHCCPGALCFLVSCFAVRFQGRGKGHHVFSEQQLRQSTWNMLSPFAVIAFLAHLN